MPKITKIDVIRNENYAKIIWVLIHDESGEFGIGETSWGPDTVETFILKEAAPYLIGQNPMQLEKLWSDICKLGITVRPAGAEIRGLSAIDMALHDLVGKLTQQPLYQLLGGLFRDKIKIYNTCAGYSYGVNRPETYRNIPGDIDHKPEQNYEDQHAFMTDAGKLAKSLLDEGVSAMKIWPFDQFAGKTNGEFISSEDIDKGLEPFQKIRDAVGRKMDIMVELHSMWNLPSAKRIAKALEPIEPLWYEDPIPMDNLDALADFRKFTHIPVTASETLSLRWSFRELFEKKAVDICMFDICWVGGISEAHKISSMAAAHHLPIAPHDCVGPITLLNGIHLSLSAPNAMIQETVRAFNNTWYRDIIETMPKIENGFVYAPEGVGIGTVFTDKFIKSKDTKTNSVT
ncbi:MAG: mandelate racemase/muconate lactonizing enzyme family protein [Chloroflexota bacterium]|nr:mandelate racemase/muconate lactonizing enzyme family protein [Chloroflexota bacterium]MQG04779.1 mandelate racemase/muconate lactonizing enzyme family protein [SAR202 cluster bacterium]|tara:strand:- start:10506 stop:11711 length:1206 start_codon:yes stop_codon:yes gene_type:complete